MKASYIREIINPVYPCKMEGYNEARFCFHQTAQQKQVSREGLRTAVGLRDDLLLDTLVLQADKTLVFYVLDIAIAEKMFTDLCRRKVGDVFHIPVEGISVSCSHTHNSPVVSHGMNNELEPDMEYWEMVMRKMIASLQFALKHMKPVRIFLDQFKINGYYNNRNRPDEEYYDKCDEIYLESEDGVPVVRLLNLACHPTILGAQNMFVSADFFGVMRRYLQGITGIPVMIFNGEAGDTSPRLLKKGVDWDECVRYGEGIGVQLVYTNHPVELKIESIAMDRIFYTINYEPKKNEYLINKEKELLAELKILPPESDRYHRIVTCYLKDVQDKLCHDRLTYETESLIFDFGSFRIVTVPCEIDTVLGKRIREKDDKPTLLCAYANGFNYYAVNKAEYGTTFESYNTYFAYGDADCMVDRILKKMK